ncbi:MAG: VCBS repeat-containing protein [Planctomycetes bacterium]|nr:VCBS repeat-containing protein [Planctomycetota bacterium]
MIPRDQGAAKALALGDLDGDADVDAFLGSTYSDRVYANDGTGAFSDVTATSLPLLPFETEAAAAGDVDADGDLDLIVGGYPNPSANRVLLNNGVGVFSLAPLAAILWQLSGTQAIALGDVDGDGDLDALVGSWSGSFLFLNGGSGIFTNATYPNLPINATDTRSIALGDVDGDGDLDALLGNAGSDRLYLNGGAGVFTDATTTNLPFPSPGSWSVALGDVDGDGDLDAFLGTYYAAGQRLLLNGGPGVFTDVTTTNLPATLEQTRAVALADVDGDGDLDAFAGIYAAGAAQDRLFLNGGAGVFSDATATNLPALLDSTTEVAFADMDADGDVDLYVGNSGPDRLCLNDGSGAFADPSPRVFPEAGDTTNALALADVDGDGDLDAFAGNSVPSTGEQNRLYLNEGTGTFSDVTAASLPALLDLTSAVAFGDVDGDGDVDEYVGNTGGFGPGAGDRLYLNGGAGVFVDVTAGNLPGVLDVTQAVALGDVEGDGDLDAFTGNSATGVFTQQNRLFLNGGTGTFSDVTSTNLPAAILYTRAVALGDLDGDGDPDAFLGNGGAAGQAEAVWLNGGTGVFTAAPATSLPGFLDSTRAVALGDVDGDGDLDALVGNSGPTSPGLNRLYLNNGGGVFTTALGSGLSPPAAFTQAVALGDLDEDGDLDAFFGNNITVYGSSPNRLFLNSGTGVFTDVTAADLPAVVADTRAVALGDVDGDGDLDVLAGIAGAEVLYTNFTRHLAWRGIPRAGKPLTLELRGPANGGWLLAAAAGSAIVPLPPVGTLRLHPPTTFIVAGGVLDAQGRASLTFPVPANPLLVGGSLYWQAIVGPPFRFTSLEITTVTNL